MDARQPGGYTKKQLPLEAKRERHPGFIEASPRGLVPALTHAGHGHVWESIHTAAYIDEAFPGRGDDLLGPSRDPLTRAHLRIWADHCTDRIQKQYYTVLMASDDAKRDEAREAFYAECRALARAMAPPETGPFFLGKHFSLVDIALAPFWQRVLSVGVHYRGLALPSAGEDACFARIATWWEAVRRRPSVAATIVCEARLVASYAQYASNEGTSDFAQGMQSSLK